MSRVGILRPRPLQYFISTLINSSSKVAYSYNHRMPSTTVQDQEQQPQQLPPFLTISVDGNISSGKSTLVSNLKKLFPNDFNIGVQLVPEPLEKWTNLKGHNLLEMFYQDPVKQNFMFQSYVQLTRLMETIKKPEIEAKPETEGNDENNDQGERTGDKNSSTGTTVRIMERSLQNNMYCFNELARRDGRLQPAEFAVLSEWYKWMGKHFDLNLDLIIYLRTTPDTVYNRMKGRARAEEALVPLEYLEKLHETYEDWLVKGPIGLKSMSPSKDTTTTPKKCNDGMEKQKIIVIDANQGKEEVAAECQRQIRAFISELGFSLNSNNTNTKSPKKAMEPAQDSNSIEGVPMKKVKQNLDFVGNGSNQNGIVP